MLLQQNKRVCALMHRRVYHYIVLQLVKRNFLDRVGI